MSALDSLVYNLSSRGIQRLTADRVLFTKSYNRPVSVIVSSGNKSIRIINPKKKHISLTTVLSCLNEN